MVGKKTQHTHKEQAMIKCRLPENSGVQHFEKWLEHTMGRIHEEAGNGWKRDHRRTVTGRRLPAELLFRADGTVHAEEGRRKEQKIPALTRTRRAQCD